MRRRHTPLMFLTIAALGGQTVRRMVMTTIAIVIAIVVAMAFLSSAQRNAEQQRAAQFWGGPNPLADPAPRR